MAVTAWKIVQVTAWKPSWRAWGGQGLSSFLSSLLFGSGVTCAFSFLSVSLEALSALRGSVMGQSRNEEDSFPFSCSHVTLLFL